MKHKKNRGFKGITGFFKGLAYDHERYKLECEYYICSPMQEYYYSHPDAMEEHDMEYEEALAKLNKKYDKH